MPFTTHYRQKTELFFVTRLPTSQEYGSFFGSYERSKRNKIHFVTKFTGIKVKIIFMCIHQTTSKTFAAQCSFTDYLSQKIVNK